VTNIELRSAETGPEVYRIGFIRNGQPYVVTYDRSGRIVEPPMSVQQRQTESRPGFPQQQEPPPPRPQPEPPAVPPPPPPVPPPPVPPPPAP
jgi:hypothetical protein